MQILIFTDGGSRGNPGPGGIGVVIKKMDNSLLYSFGKKIGVTTNNIAEYTAVVEALQWIGNNLVTLMIKEDDTRLSFFLDSTLVVNQLNGIFKIKDSNLRGLLLKVRELEQVVGGNVSYTYIPREKNFEADAMVNRALDNS